MAEVEGVLVVVPRRSRTEEERWLGLNVSEDDGGVSLFVFFVALFFVFLTFLSAAMIRKVVAA